MRTTTSTDWLQLTTAGALALAATHAGHFFSPSGAQSYDGLLQSAWCGTTPMGMVHADCIRHCALAGFEALLAVGAGWLFARGAWLEDLQ